MTKAAHGHLSIGDLQRKITSETVQNQISKAIDLCCESAGHLKPLVVYYGIAEHGESMPAISIRGRNPAERDQEILRIIAATNRALRRVKSTNVADERYTVLCSVGTKVHPKDASEPYDVIRSKAEKAIALIVAWQIGLLKPHEIIARAQEIVWFASVVRKLQE